MELHVVTGAGLGAFGPVAEPDRSASLGDRLAQVRSLSVGRTPVAFRLDPDDGPSVVVVTAAVEAGATVVVLPDGGVERDVRRAAFVTAALVAAREEIP